MADASAIWPEPGLGLDQVRGDLHDPGVADVPGGVACVHLDERTERRLGVALDERQRGERPRPDAGGVHAGGGANRHQSLVVGATTVLAAEGRVDVGKGPEGQRKEHLLAGLGGEPDRLLAVSPGEFESTAAELELGGDAERVGELGRAQRARRLDHPAEHPLGPVVSLGPDRGVDWADVELDG